MQLAKDAVMLLLDHILVEVEQLDDTARLPKLINIVAEHIRNQTAIDTNTLPVPATKLEQAFAIYDSMPGASRIEVIAMIMCQLNMSKAGASSYYSQARDRYVEEELEVSASYA